MGFLLFDRERAGFCHARRLGKNLCSDFDETAERLNTAKTQMDLSTCLFLA